MEKLWILFSLFVNCHLGNGGYVNIALNKPANQSSRYGRGTLGPGGAVDGVVTTEWAKVIHTDVNQSNAWWQVDLETEIEDGLVEIYFRTDYTYRRRGVSLITSKEPFSPTGQIYQLCHNISGDANGTNISDVFNVTCLGRWRYLMVYTNTTNDGHGPILDFGEVKVLVCDNDTYGRDCNSSCTDRHCLDSAAACPPQNGSCTCQPGWEGPDCTKVCDSGTYGRDCSFFCIERNCLDSAALCPTENGFCTCQPGWKGPDCTKVCDSGTYGRDCSLFCTDRHCLDSAAYCPTDNGLCTCQPGWKGTDCTKVCDSGTYGRECHSSCTDRHCLDSAASCPKENGFCTCQPGWKGTDCIKECPDRKCDVNVSKTSEVSLLPIVGAAVGVVIVIGVLGFIVCKRINNAQRRHINQTETIKNEPGVQLAPEVVTETSAEEDAQPLNIYRNLSEVQRVREISLGNLETHVMKVLQTEIGFQNDFDQLPSDFLASYDDSKLQENTGKNRFQGYYPYDYNRVRLSIIPGVPGSDYINASVMHLYNEKKTYIAAQAPKKKTVGDFWRMIWEQGCDRIVMLTGLVENNVAKCQPYWSDVERFETDDFRVEVKMSDQRANYTIRRFNVVSKQSGEQRSVVQYHFTSWPDHGVPETQALAEFIWRVRQTDAKKHGPLLVHCSAGIGRTGVYIAIDSLLDEARGEGKVDIFGCASQMREQRKGMIQTKEQYESVYLCLVAMIKYGDTSLDVETFTNNFNNYGMDSMVDGKTFGELAQMTANEKVTDSPEKHRMWVDGNQDFIVRVGPSVKNQLGHLLVVAPLPTQEKLLWKLVDENDVHTIIIVLQIELDMNFERGNVMKYGDITVKSEGGSSVGTELNLVTLSLKRKKSSAKRNIRVFRCEGSVSMTTLSSRIRGSNQLQHVFSDPSSVVILHSECDLKNAVAFCIMGNILTGILKDRRVDVIGHVRAILKCHPELTFPAMDIAMFHEFAQTCIQMTEEEKIYANM